jgi:hypothetical protein
MRILMLGTYPIDQPLHGGQRRAAQLASVYSNAGMAVRYLAVFPDHTYRRQPRTAQVFRTPYRKIGWFHPQSYLEDMFSGVFASTDPACIHWVIKHLRDFKPTHIHVEQPFMYPVVRMLRRRGLSGYKIIYASQNIEAPIKREILLERGSDRLHIDRAIRYLAKLETTLAANSDLVIACTEADGRTYEEMGAQKVLICHNGAEPLEPSRQQGNASDGPYMLTLGSGHPPNSSGFIQMMLGPALLFLPPRRALAVAGHMASQISAEPAFDMYRASNMRRLSFHVPISDTELATLKNGSHGFFLPITSGGGSNLKTAEAILSGKWVIGTSIAFRGFEKFSKEPGILIEDDPKRFRRAIRDTLARPPLVLDQQSIAVRRQVEWSNMLAPLRQWISQNFQDVMDGQNPLK